MISKQELNRLNEMFRLSLPTTPNGDAQFRWTKATDLFYFKQDGSEERKYEGVWLVLPRYRKRCYAEYLGNGWVVAQWSMPTTTDPVSGKQIIISEKAWARDFGNKFPYPHKGRFQPIENTLLPSGMEPDEQITRFAIHCAQEQIDAGYLEIYADEQAAVDKELAAQKAEMRDCITDLFPAFDNIPGKKYHVSFPTSN
jgi:hypothetical protein